MGFGDGGFGIWEQDLGAGRNEASKDIAESPARSERPKEKSHKNVRLYTLIFSFQFSTFNYTSPANPMKASARIPAVTSAIGTPFIPFGTSDKASCSRKPAKITNANVKPTPFDNAYIVPSNKPKSF